jgi:hypothetical protein
MTVRDRATEPELELQFKKLWGNNPLPSLTAF